MRSRSIVVAGFFLCFLHAAFAQTELLVNGDFESASQAPWQIFGTGAQIAAGTNALQGAQYLSMGNQGGAAQGAYQIVTFPTNLIAATLAFYYDTITTNTSQDDGLTVYITDTSTPPNVLRTVFATSAATPTFGYLQDVYNLATYAGQSNLSSFAGQSVEVYFYATPDPTLGFATSFNIDDVRLLIGTTADIPANDNFANSTPLTGSNVSASAVNSYATKEPGEPNHANNVGGHSLWWNWTAPAIGTVTLNTTGSTFETLLAVYTGTSVSNLTAVAFNNGNNNASGLGHVTFTVTPGAQYQFAVDGFNGQTGAAFLNLHFTVDKTAPTAVISSPKAGAKVTSSTVIVSGRAHDNVGVAAVEYRLTNAAGISAYQLAAGATNWSATITNLIPGPNTVTVRAIDTSSNLSAMVSRTFNYVIPLPVSLSANGSGTISGATNGQLLDLNYNYKITAKPAPGFLFAGWTGDSLTNSATLHFVMASNLTLTANFIPNPFLPVAGAYEGLFHDTNGIEHASSGFFSAQINNNGSFTSKFQQGNLTHSLSGQFSLEGGWRTNALRSWSNTMVSLQLNFLDENTLTGTLSNAGWTAELTANRSVYSKAAPAPQAGKYTLVIPGTNSASLPEGNGFGTVSVSAAGVMVFSGTLGDGTKVTQTAALSKQAQWPLYLSLYGGRGSLLGWLTFADEPDRDLDGMLSWINPAQSSAKLYPAGFTNDVAAMGSVYSFIKGTPVLNFSDGSVVLEGGNLAQSISNQFVLNANGTIVGDNKLKLTITPASGLFQGSATNAAGKTVPFRGVLLQKQNTGFGQFLGTNQTGGARLQAE